MKSNEKLAGFGLLLACVMLFTTFASRYLDGTLSNDLTFFNDHNSLARNIHQLCLLPSAFLAGLLVFMPSNLWQRVALLGIGGLLYLDFNLEKNCLYCFMDGPNLITQQHLINACWLVWLWAWLLLRVQKGNSDLQSSFYRVVGIVGCIILMLFIMVDVSNPNVWRDEGLAQGMEAFAKIARVYHLPVPTAPGNGKPLSSEAKELLYNFLKSQPIAENDRRAALEYANTHLSESEQIMGMALLKMSPPTEAERILREWLTINPAEQAIATNFAMSHGILSYAILIALLPVCGYNLGKRRNSRARLAGIILGLLCILTWVSGVIAIEVPITATLGVVPRGTVALYSLHGLLGVLLVLPVLMMIVL